MINRRAIKYRVYPTDGQATMFARTFGCCRKIRNLMLAAAVESHKKTGKYSFPTPAHFKKQFSYLKDPDSLALANEQMFLARDIKNFISKGESNKKKKGFPRFRSKKDTRQSYTTNNQHGTVAIVGNGIKLPKIGIVKASIHRLPQEGWKLKTATVSKDPDGKYYIALMFEFETGEVARPVNTDNATGLDYTADGLYTDDKGNKGSYKKFTRISEKRLKKEQRRLSRKVGAKKGEEPSKNYLKQKIKVAKVHKRVANQRKNHLHQITTEIANQYDVVCVETLNMKAIANRKFHNGKSTNDNSFGQFLFMLEYKMADRGKILVKVDKWFPSSQLCHKCGCRHPEMKDLHNRTMDCSCGCHIDRDTNAAINILNEGLRLLKENVDGDKKIGDKPMVGMELPEPNACGHRVSLDDNNTSSSRVVI